MKLPSSNLLIWVIVLIGSAAYMGTRVAATAPQFRLEVGSVAALLFVIGILVLIRFQWSPELVAAVAVFFIVGAVVRILGDGLTFKRIVMCIGAVFVLISYPTLRSDVREMDQQANDSLK